MLSALALSACAPLDAEGPGTGGDVEEVLGVALKIDTTTILKARLADSLELADLEKCPLKAGTVLMIDAIPRSVGHKHYAISVLPNTTPCPFDQGFVYGPHIGYRNADEPSEATPDGVMPVVPLPAVNPQPPSHPVAFSVTTERETVFKREPRQSVDLGPADRCAVAPHTQLRLDSLPVAVDASHYRVTVVSDNLRCGFRTGYVYGPHVGLQPAAVPAAPPATPVPPAATPVPPAATPVPPAATPVPPPNGRVGEKIHAQAVRWIGSRFDGGGVEDSIRFVRRVLVDACGSRFETLRTAHAWDAALLLNLSITPPPVSALAGDDVGRRLTLEELLPGDLVFLRNTFGAWPRGVLTLVGIAAGGDQYVYRADAPVVRKGVLNRNLVAGGLRVRPELCR